MLVLGGGRVHLSPRLWAPGADLIMDHVLDIGDIETPGGDVGGDQQRVVFGGESFDVLEALPLRHGGVQRKRRHPQHSEERDEAPDAVDAVAEDDRSSRILFQEVEQIQILLF